MTDYTGTTIKLPQEVARSLDQQLTRYKVVYFSYSLTAEGCFVLKHN